MSRLQKILAVLGVVAVLGGAAGGAVFFLTGGIADAATDFFATIASAGPRAAYRKTSSAFRNAESEPDFEALVERTGLRRFKAASWPSREISNGEGRLTGSVTLEDAVTLPVKVRLSKSPEGIWQVFNFEVTRPGASDRGPPASSPPAPSSPATTVPKLSATTDVADEIAVRLGDRDWTVRGTTILTLQLGTAMLVTTAPIIEQGSGKIDLTTLRLQFDAAASGPQTLTRDCTRNGPCLELTIEDRHYKIDTESPRPATLRITKAEAGRIEGVFSADMLSLEGRLAIRDGRFALTTK